jgi:hypothetical protein
MKTLILEIDTTSNATKIVEAVKLFKGVKNAHIVTPDDAKEDIAMLSAIKKGRTGKYVNTEEFLKDLRK